MTSEVQDAALDLLSWSKRVCSFYNPHSFRAAKLVELCRTVAATILMTFDVCCPLSCVPRRKPSTERLQETAWSEKAFDDYQVKGEG